MSIHIQQQLQYYSLVILSYICLVAPLYADEPVNIDENLGINAGELTDTDEDQLGSSFACLYLYDKNGQYNNYYVCGDVCSPAEIEALSSTATALAKGGINLCYRIHSKNNSIARKALQGAIHSGAGLSGGTAHESTSKTNCHQEYPACE